VNVVLSLRATRALLEELAAERPGTAAAAKLPAVLVGLTEVEDIAERWRGTEERLDSIADTLFGLASLDFSRRSEIRGDGGVLDGVVGCINMLGEELASYIEERGRIERELENRVEERTLELTRTNQELTSEIAERLRAAQALDDSRAELVRANRALQAEMHERERVEAELGMAQKLEAVGRLASGVAHEINTPVQFVSDSVQFVKTGFADLSGVIAKLRIANHAVLDGAPSCEAAAQAREAEGEADLAYLLEQAPLALDRALGGLDQVASIVRSLKAFAHPDAKEMSAVDLNRAVESTLVMARNEYKYVADAVTELGELPLVMCHPGEVNQALLNIVVNAAHAIGDVVGSSGAKGRITVKTQLDGEHVAISIADTGTGIPDDIRSRIFDPFFTTKEVGRGTGQGLAMVRSIIVDKHAGALNIDSVVGCGTTFEIRLPIEGRRRP
jgi:signal transduction histidine kinase